MRIGPVELSAVKDWDPAPGVLVSWHPTPASCAKAFAAPVSAVPPSYVQARQIRSFSEQAARGLDHSRLLIASVEVFGHCDLRAMTYVINAHLRRHDTYRSWFELRDTDHIVRHSIADPADIEFVPTTHGEMTSADLRQHIVATPDSLHWDCFSFGVIQRADSFTFYASIDHLHADGQFVGVGLMEFQSMYTALIMGEPPIGLSEAGSYVDFCVRQHEYTSALTVDSPEVRAWIDFAEINNGTFPEFPLPLGDPSVRCGGDLLSMMHWSIPGLTFVILVAVGADYNMLLISRLREEAVLGVRSGVIRTVASTGGVITAAGLIMAASMYGLVFASLGSVVQGAFVLGTGLLLDTFLVRTVTVPAIAVLVGQANWWLPSSWRPATWWPLGRRRGRAQRTKRKPLLPKEEEEQSPPDDDDLIGLWLHDGLRL